MLRLIFPSRILSISCVLLGTLICDSFAQSTHLLSDSLRGSRPNIVLFLADDQTIFDHSTYGNSKVKTPATDKFSKEALVFEKAFTGQAICAPSRSILYSGLYPIRNGCFVNHTGIRPGIKTLPYYLKELGYEVVLAGKSHINPQEQFPWSKWMRPVRLEGKPRASVPFEEINSYIRNSDKPFCLIVASEYPHGPYFEKSSFSPEDVKLHPFENDTAGHRKYVSRYYESILEKEREFEKVLDILDSNNIHNDTIVFYADDHGVFRGKFTTYDSGLNVGFMVRWPSKINPGRTKALTSFVDIVPTLIELAGNDRFDLSNFDGKSLIRVFENKLSINHDYVFAVAHNQGIINRHIFPQRSIHDGRYHYIYNFNALDRLEKLDIKNKDMLYFLQRGAKKHPNQTEEELYDTLNDPYELVNLSKNPSLLTIKNKLKNELFGWMSSQNDFLTLDSPIPIFDVKDRYQLDRLNSGYDVPTSKIGKLSKSMVNVHNL